jgi:carboxymethylenebutenolidase
MSIEDIRLRNTPARVAGPASSPRGGVVVLHQAPGYSPQTAAWLERLAAEGYLAVAPLLLHRQGVTAVNPVERFGGDVVAFAKFLPGDDEVREDVAAVLDHFESAGIAPSVTGIVGFSYGGRASYLIAAERTLGAAVSFYGGGVQRKSFEGNDQLPALNDRTAGLRTPWLGLFGEQDFMLTPGELDEWELELRKAPVSTQLIRYPDAGHAFDVDMPLGPGLPTSYAADAAEDATTRALEFLRARLH